MGDLFERGQKGRNILVRAGLRPDALGGRGDAGQGLGQIGGDFGMAGIAAGDVAQLRLGSGICYQPLGLRAVQPIADPRVGLAGVQHGFKRRHFLAALLGCGAGHHGFLIPAQTLHHQTQRLGLALMGHQFGIGLVIAHRFPPRMVPARG